MASQMTPFLESALAAVTQKYEHQMRSKDREMQQTVAAYKAELEAALEQVEAANAAAEQLPRAALPLDSGGDNTILITASNCRHKSTEFTRIAAMEDVEILCDCVNYMPCYQAIKKTA